MHIDKIFIRNFKCFGEEGFWLDFDAGTNIIVGDNESGKTSILEAIYFALKGVFRKSYVRRSDINQFFFNKDTVSNFIKEFQIGNNPELPKITIELYLSVDDNEMDIDINSLEGSNCEDSGGQRCGIKLEISQDESLNAEYATFIQSCDPKSIKTIPLEYYGIYYLGFSGNALTHRNIRVKSAFIDHKNSYRLQPSDVYTSQIIKNKIDNENAKEGFKLSKGYREMKDYFAANPTIKDINTRISSEENIPGVDGNIAISVVPPTPSEWENSLVALVNDIPINYLGQGAQSIVKTHLSMKDSKESNIILFEEPENHLSHSNLNVLVDVIEKSAKTKEITTRSQIIITTHSSFVANKIGLDKLIILGASHKSFKLNQLEDKTTYEFFKKLPGYNTLRLVLCDKAILVEGPSDELIVQKAFMDQELEEIPIVQGIDVISVGNTSLRFLEIAKKLDKIIAVVVDNDGNILDNIEKKFDGYLDKSKSNIKICYNLDETQVTLEDSIVAANFSDSEKLKNLVNILECNLSSSAERGDIDCKKLIKHMQKDKTGSALKIFDAKPEAVLYINFPKYIIDAINHVKGSVSDSE